MTIDGQGHTIDLGGKIRFLNSTTSGINLVLKNLIIKNGNAPSGDDGGAVYLYNGNGSFINCTFTGNFAWSGGAVYIKEGNGNFINSTFTDNTGSYGGAVQILEGNCNFINSTFTGNVAVSGGAVYIRGDGSFINSTFTNNNATFRGGAVYIDNTASTALTCTFNGNKAGDCGGAIYRGTSILCHFNQDGDTTYNTDFPAVINVLNYTSSYPSSGKLEFNLTADDMVFDGFNTTIDIYKDGELVKTVYGLTGEGWIVDLNPSVYTAVLSLTDYPAEKSSNATINISKVNLLLILLLMQY